MSTSRSLSHRPSRSIRVGKIVLGGDAPVVLQSMCATKTTDVAATAAMARMLENAGAGIVRVAVDTPRDAAALPDIRRETTVNLSVDLQENWRLAEDVAPHVDKIRYNPGHLHHAEPQVSWQEKVRRLADIAARYDCALRIGVNCGSLDPVVKNRAENVVKNGVSDPREDPIFLSAVEHADFLDTIGFTRFCVSLKASDPGTVVAVNRLFATERPDIPLHLGLTEAGMPPEGVLKSRLALEPLLAEGIGDTLRVSLTVPNDRKTEEIDAGRLILENAAAGTVLTSNQWQPERLNIVSCPSCARVQNEAFVRLAGEVREATRALAERLKNDPELPALTIAVMGCRVNGPGETDDADFGLWCGPREVNLKRDGVLLGAFSYEQIVPRLLQEIDRMSGNSEAE